MSAFVYKAMDGTGVLSGGEIEARSREEAYRKLLDKKLRPVQITPASQNPVADKGSMQRPQVRLNATRLLQFTEELADLLESGLQLEPALRVIENREERSPIKPVAAFLRQQIREGKNFSTALRECRGSFSELYVNMIAAAEAAGALENILRRQAQHTAILIELRKRVSMALIYPAIVFVTGIVLLCIFMMVLLPKLVTVLNKTGRELPLVTKLLIGASEFLGHYWWALLLGAGTVFLSHKLWVSTAEGRNVWDRVKLRIPLVGPILKQQFLAQFLQTLSTLLVNGVALLNALVLMRNATANTHIKKLLETLSHQVGEGASLSRCMKRSGFFPMVLIDIVAVGEQSGKIGAALQRGAARYDKEFNAKIQRLTLLIQPATILFVALFVGVIAYSMITGILTTVSGLRMR